LEAVVKAAAKKHEKVNVCVYADDFIITGVSKELLENKIKPTVEAFLNERGLGQVQNLL
jgi:RNA-directed DNA polymerase